MAEATVWQFTTVPLPRIVATDPRDGESRASPYTSFSIRFNAPVVPESVESNVAIEPAPRPDETSTYFREWDNTFVISFGAKPSTSYVVRVGPGIRDRYGNTTGQSMTVGFRTRALDPAAWLNVSERVGTYNAYQVARVFVAYRNTDRFDLSLYRLSLEEYFGAEEDWYAFTPSAEGRVRRWSVNVQSAQRTSWATRRSTSCAVEARSSRGSTSSTSARRAWSMTVGRTATSSSRARST